MKLKSLLLMARRRERLAAAQAKIRGDQFPTFTPREWADMPVFHPRAN